MDSQSQTAFSKDLFPVNPITSFFPLQGMEDELQIFPTIHLAQV